MFNPIKKIITIISLHFLVRKLRSTNNPKVRWSYTPNISSDNVIRIDILKDIYKSDCHNYLITFGLNEFSHSDLFQTLSMMFETREIDTTVDIQEVTGLTSSKSALTEHHTMLEFVEHNCRHLIEVSHRSYQHNFNHKQIEILHDPYTSDHLVMYGWSPLLYLINKGGSHHFAALRHVSSQLNILVQIKARLALTYIEENVMKLFIEKFKCYLFNKSDEHEIIRFLEQNKLSGLFFFNGNKLPYNTGLLIFRKKDWNLHIFEEKALGSVLTDFNRELEKLYSFQCSNKKFHKYLSYN